MLYRPTRRASVRVLAAGAAALALPRSFAAPEDIVIGQSAHLTGPVAASLVRVLKGQELAIEEFNRKGGVKGRNVRLITLDDAFDAKRCAENVNTLIDKEKIVALYGLSSTPNVAAALPILLEKKVPLIGVYTGAPSLRAKPHPYFFTTMASYRDEVGKMFQALSSVGRKQIAVAVPNTPFGKEMTVMIEALAGDYGATIVGTQNVELNASNATAACRALAEAKPQALISMVFGATFVPLIKAARAYIGVPIYCPTIANSKNSIEALGDEARGLAFTRILPNALRASSPVMRDYHAAMARAKLEVDYDHFFGYVNLRVLLEALRRAGPGVTPQSLVTTMQRLGTLDLGGYKLNFSPTNHHGSKFVDLSIVGPGGRYIW
jgi:branched-chain amino acid transport system substrate-binding protein